MKLLNKRAISTVAATAALTVVALIQSEAAHAFLITRSAGPLPPAGVNPSLAPPTVINFSGLSGNVLDTEASIGPGATGDGLNGGATIQRTAGSATYDNFFRLRVGNNITAPRTGEVSFRFDDPRGMGYLGFLLVGTPDFPNQASITFLSAGDTIASITMGALLGGSVPGSTVVGTGNYFSFFVTNNSEIFDQVLFTDNSNGVTRGVLFVDNVAYQAIPTPALLPGLVGVAFGAIRKRRAEAEG